MEDSFEIDTIKETNEEHSLDYDDQIRTRKSAKGYVQSKSSKGINQRNPLEEKNVFGDRTNKNYDKVSKSKQSQENLKKDKRGSHKGHRLGEEEVLSSLSGFSASDNEDNYGMKMKHTPNDQENYDDEEEEEDEEFEGQLVNKAEDLQSRFKYYDDLRKKVEEERRANKGYEKENKEIARTNAYQRPQTAYGRSNQTQDIRRSFNNLKSGSEIQNVPTKRPQTAAYYPNEEGGEEEQEVVFRPYYTKPINQDLIERKIFNYSDKRFKTIPRKNDPVSRINAFKNEWKKSKFLKANTTLKEGRKLDLAARNAVYVKKY